MLKTQCFCVQQQPGRLREAAHVIANVDAFAHEGVASLREVDSDLVRTTRFQAAGDQAEASKLVEDLNMRRGHLTRSSWRMAPAHLMLDAAAKAVAAIFDELTLEGFDLRNAVHERDVTALNVVRAKLRRKGLFGDPGARENEKPARLFVDAMHDADVRTNSPRTIARGQKFAHAQIHRVFVRVVVGNG